MVFEILILYHVSNKITIQHFLIYCNVTEGPVVCETVYETECQTSYHLHEVEEDVPNCETQLVS